MEDKTITVKAEKLRHKPMLRDSDTNNPVFGIGELWNWKRRCCVITGNSFTENNLLWVMNWKTGACLYVPFNELKINRNRFSIGTLEFIEKFKLWALDGNADAMWFLAWYFEGTDHYKSVWYYIAAMRANPNKHKWAFSRIYADARSAVMCAGYEKPNLEFLNEIPEFTELKIFCSLWMDAVLKAQQENIIMHKLH